MNIRRVRILAFSVARQWLPSGELSIDADPDETLSEIVGRTLPDLPAAAMRVALDQEYVPWGSTLGTGSEIAIIPPVSGG